MKQLNINHNGIESTAADKEAAQALVAQGDDLLQQAMTMFGVQPAETVQMAFPNVINGDAPLDSKVQNLDIKALYTDQEKLFNATEITDTGNASKAAPADPLQSAELQSIRDMYAAG